MSFFKKLFGATSFEDDRREGDRLFAEGHWGQARLSYERAIEKKKGASPDDLSHCQARERACRDGLAKGRIAASEEFLAQELWELALAELEGASEIAADAEIAAEARRKADAIVRRDARERFDAHTVSEDENFAAIAAGWEEEQAEEYAGYGDPLRDALAAFHRGEFEIARKGFEEILERASDPHFLYFEVGRARIASGEIQGGATALSAFIESIGPEEGGESRLAAHFELARLADERGDLEGALTEFGRALEAFGDDPRTYLALGNYLRTHRLIDEAVEVLESGLAVLSEQRPDFRIPQELGLALADAGRNAEAIAMLEKVVELFGARKELDLPPEGTERLADLHEKTGNVRRAADLWTALTLGSNTTSHIRYYRHAARLLRALDLQEESRRMLTRALELTHDDEAQRAEIEEALAWPRA